MKRVFVIIMVMLVASMFSCSGEKDKSSGDDFAGKKKSTETRIRSIVDPVSGEKLDPDRANYYYEYKGVRYGFNSEENMEKFKENPDKYIANLKNINIKPSK